MNYLPYPLIINDLYSKIHNLKSIIQFCLLT